MEYSSPSWFLEPIWYWIASVGWYVVGVVAVSYYVFPYIKKTYKNWKSQNDAARCKKTDHLSKYSANTELARQKLQESYNQSSILAKLKEEEEKEKKKQELLKLLEKKDEKGGRRLGSLLDDESPSTSSSSSSKPFRSGYNPLMGDNTRGYRPPKRSCCGKGGCG